MRIREVWNINVTFNKKLDMCKNVFFVHLWFEQKSLNEGMNVYYSIKWQEFIPSI